MRLGVTAFLIGQLAVVEQEFSDLHAAAVIGAVSPPGDSIHHHFLAGGLTGIALGALISVLIGKFAGWATVISTFSIALAFGFSALVGIFFGYYPASKAAGMDPIEALRYE